jgi:hypothetical protein
MSNFLKYEEFINKKEPLIESEDLSFLNYEEFLLEKKWNKDVESSHLKNLKYDSDTRVLEIEFNNGSVYQYQEVPKGVFRDLSMEHNILQKIGKGIAKGARKLFGRDAVDEGTFGTRFWDLIRRGGYEYKKVR